MTAEHIVHEFPAVANGLWRIGTSFWVALFWVERGRVRSIVVERAQAEHEQKLVEDSTLCARTRAGLRHMIGLSGEEVGTNIRGRFKEMLLEGPLDAWMAIGRKSKKT